MNRSRRLYWGRAARLMAAAGLMAIIGCGSGVLSLTGGSIPIGTSRLQGIVVRADNVSKTVPGALMKLTLGSASADYVSGVDGHFDLGKIPGGMYACAIQTPFNYDLGTGWAWPFELPENTEAYMVAALWPRTFDPSKVDHVTLAPTDVTLHVGDSARFVATAYDKNNQPIPLHLSLLLEGDSGALSANGAFRATSPGHSRITAWMPGSVAHAEITVIP